MPFVPAPNVVMVEWRCNRNGQRIENRLMIDLLTAPTLALMNQLRVDMWNWWENFHSTVLHSEVQLSEVVVTDMSVQNGNQVVYAPDTTTVGQMGGFALPNEVSMCVSLRSGARGRSARGRWYQLSVSDAQLNGTNTMSPAAPTAICGTMTQLLADITAEGFAPVIVSYQSNGVPRPGGPVYFVIQNATIVDPIVDSMRRRKPGVGS
jgi:hypothetical protein